MKSRLTDWLLGVSRRRRRFAYAAIGTGLALLRPALVRVAWTATLVIAGAGITGLVLIL